jgi:hypothetical protein
MLKLGLQTAKISALKSNPNNPRVIKNDKFAKLVKSIQEFPEMLDARPIVCTPDGVVLGGNMRLKASIEAGVKTAPVHVVDWPESKQAEFVIKDNASFGEWDWDALANQWSTSELEEWGLDIWQPEIDAEDLSDGFNLADGEKPPFQSMTFTLADEQAQVIANALADAKALEEFKWIETMGNENANGNALYFLVSQWAEQKK